MADEIKSFKVRYGVGFIIGKEQKEDFIDIDSAINHKKGIAITNIIEKLFTEKPDMWTVDSVNNDDRYQGELFIFTASEMDLYRKKIIKDFQEGRIHG